MIKEKDVIRMRVPFPTINDNLAVHAHMYICRYDTVPHYRFIKCQTLKPWMLGSNVFVHYIDEPADPSRNPFDHTTRIDCDKLFFTDSVTYDDGLKTSTRPDICQELYDKVKTELDEDGYQSIAINENELASINHLINKI